MGGCYDSRPCSPDTWWNCAWRQSQLRDALATQIGSNSDGYNEFIVSAEYWEAHLPSLIQAILCREDCDRARQVHDGYLAEYGRTAAQTPLVFFDGSAFVDIS